MVLALVAIGEVAVLGNAVVDEDPGLFVSTTHESATGEQPDGATAEAPPQDATPPLDLTDKPDKPDGDRGQSGSPDRSGPGGSNEPRHEQDPARATPAGSSGDNERPADTVPEEAPPAETAPPSEPPAEAVTPPPTPAASPAPVAAEPEREPQSETSVSFDDSG